MVSAEKHTHTHIKVMTIYVVYMYLRICIKHLPCDEVLEANQLLSVLLVMLGVLFSKEGLIQRKYYITLILKMIKIDYYFTS